MMNHCIPQCARLRGLHIRCGAVPPTPDAARVGVLSNKYFAETAADFNSNIAGHTFTAVDVSAATPTLAALTANYDVLLLFEDGTFANAPTVGNVVAAFATTGRPVVLGTFYDQDRSDSPPTTIPHGWGALETIDPNTTDGTGTPYASRTLNTANDRCRIRSPPASRRSPAPSSPAATRPSPARRSCAIWTQPNALRQARSGDRLSRHRRRVRDPRRDRAATIRRSARPASTSAAISTAPGRTRSTSARRAAAAVAARRDDAGVDPDAVRQRASLSRCCSSPPSGFSRAVARHARGRADRPLRSGARRSHAGCISASSPRRAPPDAAASSSRTARVDTPVFMPVGTYGTVKAMAPSELDETRRADRARQHVPPVAAARPRGDRRARRPAPLHGLGAARSSPTPAASRCSASARCARCARRASRSPRRSTATGCC